MPDSDRDSRTIAEWSRPAWRAKAVAWADERLAEHGARRDGEVTQPRVRAWATVLRIPTTAGVVWLKAASFDTAFEVRSYPLLARVAPDHVLHPLATDAGRGWLLLPDAGPSMSTIEPDRYLGILERVLPQYGELQIALMPHVESLLREGVPDMRPERGLERFDEAAAAVRPAATGSQRSGYERALQQRDTFGGWARRLAASPVPPSLDHQDLHAGNILIPPAGPDARTRFYDWGDSVIAHPFASMLLGLGWVRAKLSAADDDPRIVRLRDAYLEPFAEFGPRAELVETLELACRVAKAARAITWARAVAMEELPGFERAPVTTFAGIAADSYLSDH